MAEPKYPTQREKVEELAKKIEVGTKEFMQSDKYRTYLRTMSKFHSYSFRNCLLIAMQKPDATLVASYQAWQKKFERQVGRGETGIRIFAPVPYEEQVEKEKRDFNGNLLYSSDGKPVTEEVTEKCLAFRVTTVFDVSQTSGKPLLELATELDGSVEQYEMLFQAIRDTSEAPITVETFPAGNEAKGYYSPSTHSIHVRDDISEVQSVKTVLHELAHSILHNKDAEDAAEKSRMTMEIEAESVAFIVSDHFGIDTSDYSFAYLASWSSDADLPELHQSLDTIQKTANDLIQKVSARYQELAQAAKQENVPHMAQSADEKSQKTILGNTAYRDIPDKAFVVTSAEQTAAIIKGLKEQNIPYCCKIGDARGDVFTVSREHLQQLMELKQAAGQVTGELPPHKQKPQPEITIIGNAPYRDIPDKAYVRVDAAAVDAIIRALEDAGVKYSGKLDPAKGNVITVPKEHKAMVEEIQKRMASTLSDQPRQQFMKVTEEQLKALQAEDTPLQVRKSGSAYIISFATTEKARIGSALQALESNQKVKR